MSSAMSPTQVQQLLAGPAATPPPGVMPHFGGPLPFVTPVVATFVIAHVLISICVPIRLWTQYFVSNGLAPEDYIITIATIIHICLDAVGILCVQQGLHKHMWNITLANYIDLMKRVYAYGIIYSVTTCLIKIAILLQLVHIFATYRMNRVTFIACWTAVTAIVIFTIVNVFLMAFQCHPIEGAWNVLEAQHCISLEKIYRSSGIWNIFSDFAILLIPIPIILQLHMSLRKRLAIAAVFATGSLACVASILRYVYIMKIFDTGDVVYWLGPMGLVSTIEQTIGILIFCVPKVHQFYLYIRREISKSTTAASLLTSDVSNERGTKEATKGSREPYSMPSLASFEERDEESRKASTLGSQLDRLPSIKSVSSRG